MDPHARTEEKFRDVTVRGVAIRQLVDNGRLRVWADRFEEIEPELLDWIQAFPEGSVFYDLGASIGNFSLFAAIAKNVDVVAFEPEAQNYATLERNHFLNRDRISTRFTSLNLALGAKASVEQLYCRSYGAGEHGKIVGTPTSREGGETFQPEHVQSVLVQTLDEMVSRYLLPPPTHIKIDVDGSELAVMRGARAVLSSGTVKSVFIEIDETDATNRETCLLLEELGFAKKQVFPVVRLRGGHYEGLFNCIFEKKTDRVRLPVLLGRPLLPSFDEVRPYLEDILTRALVSNGGPYSLRLEDELKTFFGGIPSALVTNATVGLDLALRCLCEEGEIITTAYSFAATYHALFAHSKIRPIFVDIDDNYCIDPAQVEKRIRPQTKGILAVHAYGYPCSPELERVAREYGLFVLYDAAHAFGVRIAGESIANRGDASVFSFHATKVFTTVEGGCVSTQSQERFDRIRRLRNFGIAGPDLITEFGINGKLDEIRASFGLATLPKVRAAIARRGAIVSAYRAYFHALGAPEISIRDAMYERADVELNYAYFPVLIRPKGDLHRDAIFRDLEAQGIFTRKYFFPTITTAPLYSGLCDPSLLSRSDYVSRNVLCLPVHHAMTDTDVLSATDAFGKSFARLR